MIPFQAEGAACAKALGSEWVCNCGDVLWLSRVCSVQEAAEIVEILTRLRKSFDLTLKAMERHWKVFIQVNDVRNPSYEDHFGSTVESDSRCPFLNCLYRFGFSLGIAPFFFPHCRQHTRTHVCARAHALCLRPPSRVLALVLFRAWVTVKARKEAVWEKKVVGCSGWEVTAAVQAVQCWASQEEWWQEL